MRPCRCRQLSVSHAGDIERTNIHVQSHEIPFYIKILRCSILLHCIVPIVACQGWCLPCVQVKQLQLSLAPACSCRWLTVRSPDSAAQTAILCVIGKGGSNEPRSAELSRLRVSRASSPTTHISFLPSDRSSLFVKPFLFFTCRRQTNRLFSPALARKAFNPIQFTFPHRLPFPFFDTPRSEFPSPSTLNDRRSLHGFSPSWTPRLNRRPATPLR